jgi:flagellar basal body-associated protein FliL
MVPWILIGIFALIVLLAVAALVMKKGKRQKPSYKTFFIMGITWLPVGIVLDNYGLSAMGLIFMIVGLVHRNEWEDEPKWGDLPEEQKRLKIILIVGLSLLLVAGVAAFFLVGGK